MDCLIDSDCNIGALQTPNILIYRASL